MRSLTRLFEISENVLDYLRELTSCPGPHANAADINYAQQGFYVI